MSDTRRAVIPEGEETFSHEDFATATERVNDVRDAAMADPALTAAVEAKTAAMTRRVATLAESETR